MLAVMIKEKRAKNEKRVDRINGGRGKGQGREQDSEILTCIGHIYLACEHMWYYLPHIYTEASLQLLLIALTMSLEC